MVLNDLPSYCTAGESGIGDRTPQAQMFGQSKIQKLGVSTVGYEDVRWLEVAMDNGLPVRSFERIGDLQSPIEKCFQRQNLPSAVLWFGLGLPAPMAMCQRSHPAVPRRKWCRYSDGSGRRQPVLRAGSGAELGGLERVHRGETSGPRNGANVYLRPCRPRPCRRSPASR